jgi:hypothetical protein
MITKASVLQQAKTYSRLADFVADNNVQCAACNSRQIGSTQGHVFGEVHAIRHFACLGCKKVNIEIAQEIFAASGRGSFVVSIFRYPNRPPRDFALPDSCPDSVSGDYREAARLLAISPMASAAFARRCLQTLLRERGYRQRDLVEQISALLAENDPVKIVPHYVTSSLDAIRNFGNFSAHPVEDKIQQH